MEALNRNENSSLDTSSTISFKRTQPLRIIMGFLKRKMDAEGVEDGTSLRRSNVDIRDSETEHRDVEGWKSFAEDATLHGARFFFADNFFRRLLWIAAVLGYAIFCNYQVYTFVRHFYERPFNTKITFDRDNDENAFPFPAVTLCNLNALNKRKLIKSLTNVYGQATVDKKLQGMYLIIRRSKAAFTKEFKERNPEFFHRSQTVNETLTNFWIAGDDMEDMLLPTSPEFSSCSINGKQCNAHNFTSSLSAFHGLKCHTFNSAEGGNPLLNTTVAGLPSGLRLRLNIERDEYIPIPWRPSVGILLLIHEQKTFLPVEEFGIVIQPGMSSLCAIKRRKVKRKIRG